MSNNKETMRTLVFVALGALMVGAVTATVFAYSIQADGVPDRALVCNEKSPGAGGPPPCSRDRVIVPR